MKNLAFAGVVAGLVLVGACTTYDDGPEGTDSAAKSAPVCRKTAADWLSDWPAGTCFNLFCFHILVLFFFSQ